MHMVYQNKNILASRPQPKRKRLLLIASSVVVVAILVVIGVLFMRRLDPPATTASSATKGEVASPTPTPGTPATQPSAMPASPEQSSTSGRDKDNTAANNAPLIEPSGTFVSNHHPNLSGQPAPNTIQSVCATTPGATCHISFTKDGVTKTLPEQKADNGGATYWNWKLQDYGLTAGSWRVQAIASLGSQTKTTDDAMALEVSQ